MKKLALVTTVLIALCASPALAHTDGLSTPMEKAISRLPHDKAEEFRDSLQSAHEENKDLYEQMRQLHRQMHDIMTADTFDEDAFVSKGEELRQTHDKIAENLDAAFAYALSELSPAQRQMMARAFEHQRKAEHKAKKEE